MMVEHGEDVMALLQLSRRAVRTAPLERLTRPGPKVEVWVYMSFLKLRHRYIDKEQAFSAKIVSDARAYGALSGI